MEVYTCLSGSERTLVYSSTSSFTVPPWWRANVSKRMDGVSLEEHRRRLSGLGVEATSMIYRPEGSAGSLQGGPLGERIALETYASPQSSVSLIHHFLHTIVGCRDEPSSWVGNGPLPNKTDGLKQVRISMAIEESAA